MPDFWDKLFKTNLGPNDPSYAINGVAAVLVLYARDLITTQQIVQFVQDSSGDPMSQDDIDQAQLLIDLIDAETNADPFKEAVMKLAKAQVMIEVMRIVELGWINKTQAKNLLGV